MAFYGAYQWSAYQWSAYQIARNGGTPQADNAKSGVNRLKQNLAARKKHQENKAEKPAVYNAKREALIAEREFRKRVYKTEQQINSVDQKLERSYNEQELSVDLSASAAILARRRQQEEEAINMAILMLVA